MNSSKQTVYEHLQELRSRLLLCLIPLVIGAGTASFFYKQLLKIFLSPLHQAIYFTSPIGGLSLIITLCLLCGIIFALPFLTYQIVKFIEPAVSKFSQRKLIWLIFASFILMLSGISFAYFVSLPAALHFLIGFESDNIKPLISVQEYFSFATYYILGFGIIFQLPLIMLVINSVYRLKIKKILSFQRIVILFSFIIGAILTPTPDPINQTIMAVPVILLYYLSILLIAYVNKHTLRRFS